jgi:hypothetical protein
MMASTDTGDMRTAINDGGEFLHRRCIFGHTDYQLDEEAPVARGHLFRVSAFPFDA